MLFGALKMMHYVGLMSVPGWLVPQLAIVFITAMLGIALGLVVSAIVKTSEMATSLVPLILIPQILFSGLVGVPEGASKAIGTFFFNTTATTEIYTLSLHDALPI